jgi:hypothetical protein
VTSSESGPPQFRVAVATNHDYARRFADQLMVEVESGRITTTRKAEQWLRSSRRELMSLLAEVT